MIVLLLMAGIAEWGGDSGHVFFVLWMCGFLGLGVVRGNQ